MPEKSLQSDEAQVNRAERLHKRIDEIKSGAPAAKEPGRKKSLKEEIADRAAKLKKQQNDQ